MPQRGSMQNVGLSTPSRYATVSTYKKGFSGCIASVSLVTCLATFRATILSLVRQLKELA